MKAITTKFLSCTYTKGARIKASEPDGKSVTISYPHELNTEDCHRKAAEMLRDRMDWTGQLIGAWTGKGYVWVFRTCKGE